MLEYKSIKKCRICGKKTLRKFLDLGLQPLANALIKEPSEVKKYPLEVLFCETCGLSQLSVVVDPEVLYANYPYHSSVSSTFQTHCRNLAETIEGMMNRDEIVAEGKNGKYVITYNGRARTAIDIGSNDGCLLEEFERMGFFAVGVEPSTNLALEANSKDLNTYNDFWSISTALNLPPADVITATNCFAHVDDLYHFCIAVDLTLSKTINGIFVIEVPYIYNLLENAEFDTVYHEHLSYFAFRPLREILLRNKLRVFKVERVPIHGGSLRVYSSPNSFPIDESVYDLEEFERVHKLNEFSTYQSFSEKVQVIHSELTQLLYTLRDEGKTVYGYGASAKGATLLNFCGIDQSLLPKIIDDTPAKQGKYIPGCNIPIVSKDAFRENPDYILLLSWNFAEELKKKTIDVGARYIIPIPNVRIE